MAGHKLIKNWIILIFIAFFFSLIISIISRGAKITAIPVVILIILLVLFLPVIVIDLSRSSKIKEQKGSKELEKKQAELDLAKSLKEEQVQKPQQEVSLEVIEKFCKYCGKKVDKEAKICSYCGSDIQ
ncbi:MAG: zinc ribbon domain-containing protein [Promethearchaeota archaeon]